MVFEHGLFHYLVEEDKFILQRDLLLTWQDASRLPIYKKKLIIAFNTCVKITVNFMKTFMCVYERPLFPA